MINSPSAKISSSFDIPESLFQLINKAWQNRYEEFYEQADRNITLEETLLKILDALECHNRYVCMAIILALAVKPTVKHYLPNESQTESIFQLVINWLENKDLPTEETINQLFPQKSLGSQAIDEALDGFKNLLLALNPANAKEALLEILDDCLEGYAIFPGSQGRRDLFNWFLLEVVPAAWCLQLPENIYTIKGIQSLDRKFLTKHLSSIDNLLINNYEKQLSPQNCLELGSSLFRHLNINFEEVPLEKISHYTAVEYFLTVEDEPNADATNSEKVKRYREAFYHLCEVQDWHRAKQILCFGGE